MLLYKQEINDRQIGSWNYAFGVIAARETKLLKQDAIDRLFAARTLAEYDSLRVSMGYSGDDYRQAIELSKKEDYRLLSEIMPQGVYLELLLLANEYHNLKAMLKAQLLAEKSLEQSDLERISMGPYLTDPQKMLEFLQEKSNDLKVDLRTLVARVKENWLATYDVANLDNEITQAYWQELITKLAELDDEFLRNYFALQRDLINIEAVLRANQLNMKTEQLAKVLLPEGQIKHERLLNWLTEGVEVMATYLRHNGFKELAEVASEYGKPGTASLYASASDKLLLNFLREQSTTKAGPVRVLLYFLRREQERKNIELAHIAVANQLSEERIREIKREVV